MPLLVAHLRILLKQGRSEVINLHPMAEESNLHRELLLSAIGLREVMIERNYIDPFDKDLFHRYTSKEYLHSPHKEMDEVYRMCEVVLLHKATGLRAEYLTTESYEGDELRYRVRDVFIITTEGKRTEATGIDFNRHLFVTPGGEISFEKVKQDHRGD